MDNDEIRERARERARVIGEVLREIWDARPAIRAPKKLWLAAIQDPRIIAHPPKLTETFVKEWTRDEPRRQAHWKPKKEWPGRNQISYNPNIRWNIDLMDWSTTSDEAKNDGYNYVLFVQDAHTRYVYARPVRSKAPGPMRTAFMEILDEAGVRPRQIVHDRGPEFTAAPWVQLMKDLNIVDRLKAQDKQDNRCLLYTSDAADE